jgi:hypothetical protein
MKDATVTVIGVETKPKTHKKAQYWDTQITAAKKRLEKWQNKAELIVKRYKGERGKTNVTQSSGGDSRLNLFYSNTSTLEAMLYGSKPKVDVARRFADADDDVSRVASNIMERLLNNDVTENINDYDSLLTSSLQDRLLSGLGCAKVRYTHETTDEGELKSESAPIDYIFWGDVLWGWGRNFAELPWVAFRSYMTKEEATKRFGKEYAKELDYSVRTTQITDENAGDEDRDAKSQGTKAEIWEIWEKSKRVVYWVSAGVDELLDEREDPLQLTKFYPCPPFFLANPTTTLYVPTPDFLLAEDQYNEIDILQTRISIITEAVKAVGVYDSANSGVERIFTEGVDNTLIPIDSWAIFAEKGGIAGAVDWVPIVDIVNALDKLIQMRDQNIGLLQQVTGMADVMRGSLDNQYEGVGQSQMKAKFGSVRLQALQDQFAMFASNLMKIKAEVIARHFSPETIVQLSNMEYSPDREIIPSAVQLIKNPEQAKLSIVIRPETIAMADYAQLKNERVEFLDAITGFMAALNPIVNDAPAMQPFMMKMLQWGLAGFKGAQEIEGVVDQAIKTAEEEAEKAKQKPSPEEQQAQMEQQKEQAKLQTEIQKIQAKSQADMQTREQDKQADMETAAQQHQLDMQKMQAEFQIEMQQMQTKAEIDMQLQESDAAFNVKQAEMQMQAEVKKSAMQAQLNAQNDVGKHKLKMAEQTDKAAKDKEGKANGKGSD